MWSAGRNKEEQALVDPTLQIDPDRPHIADDLVADSSKEKNTHFSPRAQAASTK
jgi:hypothetical protein